MEPSQATDLIGYLVAVFRPRDFGDASANAYATSIQDFDYDEARRSVEWIAEHDQFFPALARLRAEIGDDYDAPLLTEADRPSLPGAIDRARFESMTAALPGDVVEPPPPAPRRTRERHIPYDPAEVERRKAEVRDAIRREMERLGMEAEA